ncbi:MAG: hypothetical protein JAY97_08850 [Candidatus Thiodiazotropha sp. 'RUGA']|nr:hypothetical protein [Candidatus Thiodiazotropha sp. 'RUGA']
MNDKRNMPVGSCTICGETTFNACRINERCSATYNGKRCNGAYGSALKEEDWEECSSCNAVGRISSKRCIQCDGVGWIFVRRIFY